MKRIKTWFSHRKMNFYHFRYNARIAWYFFKRIIKYGYSGNYTALKIDLEIIKEGLGENRVKEKQEIDTFLRLFNKVHNEDYIFEHIDILEKEYNCDDLFDVKFVKNESPSKTYSLVFNYEEILKGEELDKFAAKLNELEKIGEEKQKKAKRILYKYYFTKSDNWW